MKPLKRYQYERYAILCKLAYPPTFDHTIYGFSANGRYEITDRWGRTIIRVLWGDKKEVVVVFKGSQNLWDWLLNMACLPKQQTKHQRRYYIHWGYHFLLSQKSKRHRPYQAPPDLFESQCIELSQASDQLQFGDLSVYQHIEKVVTPLIAAGKKVTFTGHSSGGAMAILVADRLSASYPDAIKRVVTFGQPAAGLRSFKRHYQLNHCTYRICCDLDIVTFLPPIPFMYWHVGKLLWLHEGRIYENSSTPYRLYKSLISWLLRPVTYHYMRKYIRNKDFFDKH
ncbi:lipase [Photobacterium sp. MCCC 1A19761]|uniref:lipase family protein n=1 Tax=Photobacterium sp. MCCC 1A19761 TaxID=3115000 RepID=UPI00307EDA4C